MRPTRRPPTTNPRLIESASISETFPGGTEAERTAYAPSRGRDQGHIAEALRAIADRDNMRTRGTGSSRMVIQPTPGGLDRWHGSKRGPKFVRTGIGNSSRRTARRPPGKSSASHRMTIISRSIIVVTPRLGWFLLPNTPLVKKTRCLLFVGFGRLGGPPKTLCNELHAILTELWKTATANLHRVER